MQIAGTDEQQVGLGLINRGWNAAEIIRDQVAAEHKEPPLCCSSGFAWLEGGDVYEYGLQIESTYHGAASGVLPAMLTKFRVIFWPPSMRPEVGLLVAEQRDIDQLHLIEGACAGDKTVDDVRPGCPQAARWMWARPALPFSSR